MESQIDSLLMMGLAVVLNLIVAFLTVRILCHRKLICNFNKPSLILFNMLILIFCTILIRLDISMGMGVGLFAVLAMFRFRSEVLKTQEMFYLLLLIAIGFIHAAFPKVLSLEEVLFVDITILGMIYFLAFAGKKTASKFKITVDDLELIKPQNEELLRLQLEEATGFHVANIEIVNVELKKGRALLIVQTDPDPKPLVEKIKGENIVPTFELRRLSDLPFKIHSAVS